VEKKPFGGKSIHGLAAQSLSDCGKAAQKKRHVFIGLNLNLKHLPMTQFTFKSAGEFSRLFIFILFAGLCPAFVAQPAYMWAKQIGTSNADEAGYAVTTDAAGNIYAAGTFSGTTDLDPGPGTFTASPVGPWDIYLVKLDASGNFVWAKTMGGTANDNPLAITLDAAGNILLTGFFWGTADFDPGPGSATLTSNGDYDIFLVKLDAMGNYVWAKNYGGSGRELANAVTLDGSGNIYLTGYFNDTTDFDPGPGTYTLVTTNQWADIYVAKLNASGNLIWAKKMGGTYVDIGRGITVDKDKNVYTAGWFSQTADLDPGPASFTFTAFGGDDVFLSKLDSMGNFVWAKQLGGAGYDHCHAIACDTGAIYFTGNTELTADFDPGPGVHQLSNGFIYVSKFSLGGNLAWAKIMEGGGGGFYITSGHALKLDAAGNVHVAGVFGNTVDFDPGPYNYNLTSAGSNDAFVLKLTNAGNFICAGSMGGTGIDVANSLALNTAGDMISTGKFVLTADFDPGTGVNNLVSPDYDAFVSRLGGCLNVAVPEIAADKDIALFPNPNNGSFTMALNADSDVRVTDLLGQTIFNERIAAGELKVALPALPEGVYFVNISNHNGYQLVKMIKQ
jgi:hypothetical protein